MGLDDSFRLSAALMYQQVTYSKFWTHLPAFAISLAAAAAAVDTAFATI
jgi:hypothetical protein